MPYILVEGKDVNAWLEVKAQLKKSTRDNSEGSDSLRRDKGLLNQHHKAILSRAGARVYDMMVLCSPL